jgi:hypothetical protein
MAIFLIARTNARSDSEATEAISGPRNAVLSERISNWTPMGHQWDTNGTEVVIISIPGLYPSCNQKGGPIFLARSGAFSYRATVRR